MPSSVIILNPIYNNMTISVFGLGYVGCVSLGCLYKLGHSVVGVDVSGHKVDLINQGKATIIEDQIDELISDGVSSKRIRATLDVEDAVDCTELSFFCVGTPVGSSGKMNLNYVKSVAAQIGEALRDNEGFHVVAVRSTVPPGTCEMVTEILETESGKKSGVDFAVISNPEFLREGSAIHDFLHPDRIVVGSDNQEAAVRVAALYEKTGAPVVVTDPASAETIKYAANAFLATKISYINAVAAICEGVGADVNDVVLGLGYDKRIGHEFLRPGPGWGGSCFPKDTKAMVKIAQDAGYDFGLLKGVIAVNDQQYGRIVDKIRTAAGGSLKGKKIASWGLTFKALTDDLRDSPAVEIVMRLLASGASVSVFDPTVSSAPKGLEAISIASSPLDACADADNDPDADAYGDGDAGAGADGDGESKCRCRCQCRR
jgi:UDPglucose 6-dehydrogenase